MKDNAKAKKYNNIKLIAGIVKGLLSFALLLMFVVSGYSLWLENYVRNILPGDYTAFLLYVLIAGAVSSILFFPLNYYSGFYLEHRFGLSNQSFFKWIFENAKESLVGALIGIPLLLVFYFVLKNYGAFWWLPFWAVVFIVSIVLARIVPVFILPLFYKITPVEDKNLRERIIKLSESVGLKVQNVFKFDMSKNTKKANAAFTGIGKSKRILLGDTLLDNYTIDEIETVIAHELGHYKYKHIIKNISIGTALSFISFFLIARLHAVSLEWFSFNDITKIAGLPLLALWAMVIGLIETPLSNWISRKYEYEADGYAVESTGKPDAFLNTLGKLTDQNLGDKEPHPIIEWFFYSHPSIKKRTANIQRLAAR